MWRGLSPSSQENICPLPKSTEQFGSRLRDWQPVPGRPFATEQGQGKFGLELCWQVLLKLFGEQFYKICLLVILALYFCESQREKNNKKQLFLCIETALGSSSLLLARLFCKCVLSPAKLEAWPSRNSVLPGDKEGFFLLKRYCYIVKHTQYSEGGSHCGHVGEKLQKNATN